MCVCVGRQCSGEKGINLCKQTAYKKTMYLKCSNKCKTVIYLESELYLNTRWNVVSWAMLWLFPQWSIQIFHLQTNIQALKNIFTDFDQEVARHFCIYIRRINISLQKYEFFYTNIQYIFSSFLFDLHLPTSVIIYRSTQCNIPEDINFHQHCWENLKPHKISSFETSVNYSPVTTM
jgi:hypothetical protein